MRCLGIHLVAVVVVVALAANAGASIYTGSIDSSGADPNFPTLIATSTWGGGGASLSWIVDDTTNPGYWTYAYTFTGPGANQEVSHVILEVSSTFTANNIHIIWV